jgi:hypothetical protein
MASTYEPIATTTVSGTSTNSITYNTLGSYTDIIIISNGTFNTADNGYNLTFNGDTTSGLYSTTYLYGTGSGSGSSIRTTGQNAISAARMDTTFGVGITHVMNYGNATTYKTVLSRGNSSSLVNANVGLWRNTNSITSLNVACPAGISYFVAGTTFTLYGIKAA